MSFEATPVFAVPDRVREGSENPITSMDAWRQTWLRSRFDPDAFWLAETRSRVAWRTVPQQGLQGGYDTVAERPFSWFADGTLNITETCLDQHLTPESGRHDKTAILWEGDDPGDVRTLTYAELAREVNKAANALKALGVDKGDRVVIYMGMVPEAAIAMLACARLGAIHSVVFGGFSAEALRDRIRDCKAEVVITQDEGLRGKRTIPLKAGGASIAVTWADKEAYANAALEARLNEFSAQMEAVHHGLVSVVPKRSCAGKQIMANGSHPPSLSA